MICEHYCLSKCLAEIEDLANGMNIFEVFSILKEHKHFPELLHGNPSLASDVLGIYDNIHYSELKDVEEEEADIYYNFSNFVEALEHDNVKIPEVIEIDEDVLFKKEKIICLSDLVQFLTGSKFVLPNMTKQGSIYFKRDACFGERITCSTCLLKLTFPINKRYSGSSESFNKLFIEDIVCSPGFGRM